MGYEGAFSNQQPTMQRSGPNGAIVIENDVLSDKIYLGSPGFKPTQIVPSIRRSVEDKTGMAATNIAYMYGSMPWLYAPRT